MNSLQTLRSYRQQLLGWRGSIHPEILKKELTQVREDISYYIRIKNRK